MENKNKFIIIPGMPRAGSSWLFYNLKNHPDICPPEGYKETFFFGANFVKGFNWYYSIFKPKASQICLDASPDYFLNDKFLDNISQFKNDFKIILVLRDPDEWAISLYNQTKSFAPNIGSFDDFLENCKVQIDGNFFEYSLNKIDIKKRIDFFLKMFEKKILLINFNFLIKNQVLTLQKIENFLDINQYFNENNVFKDRVNVSIGKFSYLKYLSTLKYSRFLAFKLLPNFIINFLRKKLYKIDEKKLLSSDSPSEKNISNFFPKVTKDYFIENDIRNL